MRIKVIGSGSMWNEHNSASYMIDDNTLVDIPNGTCKNLFRMGINPKIIDSILITHFHGDHFFDIPFYFLLKTKADNKNINIYCSKDGKRKNHNAIKLAFPNSVKDINNDVNLKYCYNEDFSLNGYRVTKYLVDHGRMKPAYGYVFESNNKKVGFTGDTSLCENVEVMASICDYLFCDCMFIKGTDQHMGIDNIKMLIDKYPHCQYVVSHLEDNTRQVLKEENISNIIVPNDGDVIEV
ncbi:MAG: ribonuclease Z [Bacilli bacterium]|nr:ribonuclease Z [Bacilli bacterium]